MRDGLPGDVFPVVSLPTNFVRSSPYFTITNLAVKNPHQLPQSASESIALTYLCASKMHSTPGQSMTWLCSQHLFLSLEPNSYSWLPCFCQLHPSQGSCRVRCDGCGTIFPITGCVRQWRSSALLRGTSTVPLPSVACCLRALLFFCNWDKKRRSRGVQMSRWDYDEYKKLIKLRRKLLLMCRLGKRYIHRSK